ncbi:hypothetical protein KQI41_01245 [Tissierella pigra]|uniref:hypothetical protein n=1 Tax=Tissierella pigra TaxID=2607614 RepID=UPI001C11B015|nr:hypothetical protein [Tissierella pigra]MBU5425021.1 hypothetical protein [Tissierella pigra]
MITAEEFVQEIDDKEENKNYKLGIVVDLFENATAKIQFDGEDTPSEKQYAYLDSYIPKKDDRILLGAMGGTYVILGKVNYNVSPSTEEEIDRYLFDLKKVIMQKGLNITDGLETDTLTVNNGATINGEVTATKFSSTGAITGTRVDVAGEVKGNSLNIANSVKVNGLTSNGTLYAESTFLHRGSHLSFFGKSSVASRQTVFRSSGTPTPENLQLKINELISALEMYGLIG